jgi:hypothetical protein
MSKHEQRQSLKALAVLAIASAAAMLCVACGGAGGSAAANPFTAATSTSAATGSTAYAAAYKTARWSAGAVTVGFSDTCTMTLTTTGVPPSHANYYLGPVSPANPTSVAVTPVTGTELAVYPFNASNIAGGTSTINVCPAKAATTTATGLGPIGYTLSGEALFNPYEANGSTPALTDNVSYTFTTGAGKTETASFIDACNSHAAAGPAGATWHYHAVPTCLTAQVDGSTGPSHLLGVALDGFPIYGGRDVDGNVVSTTQLDACNGITSPTPEFPAGAYHYVLPIGVTGKQSSLTCYSGTVSRAQLAARTTALCGMAALNARLQAAARARRLNMATRVLAQERFPYGPH